MIFINRDLDEEQEGERETLLENLAIQSSKQQNKINNLARISRRFSVNNLIPNATISPIITAEEKEELMKKYGNTTRVMGAGSYFGEKALLDNEKRSATIIVEENLSEIISLDKKYFQHFIEHLDKIHIARSLALKRVFPELNDFTKPKVDNVLYCFTVSSQPERASISPSILYLLLTSLSSAA